MSTPENPLARFRSYSYHHILIACQDSGVASALLESKDFLGLFLEQTQTTQTNRIRSVKNTTPGLDATDYVVIINGMVDADLSISSIEWDSSTAANAVEGDRYNSLAVEGVMTIREPRGFRFMGRIKDACAALGKDTNGVVWMLKTVFVGHGNSEFIGDFTEMMTNIKPLLFFMENVTGTFDETGSQYEIKFAGNNDGYARLPQMMRVANGITVRLGGEGDKKDISLVGAMAALETKVNEIYDSFYNCVVEGYKKSLNASSQTQTTDVPFQRVHYSIKLEKPYTDTSAYKVTDGPQQSKDGIGKCDDPLILKLGQSATVEEGMREIMSRCIQVKKDAENTTQAYTYKITSTIKSGSDIQPTKGDVNKTNLDAVQFSNPFDYVVEFKIQQFPIVSNDLVTKIINQQAKAGVPPEFPDNLGENLLTLDYIYTGKNIDIINFDIKMQLGMAFLQITTTSDNVLEQRSTLLRNYKIANPDNRLGTNNIKSPLFLGVPIKDPALRNSQDSSATLSFDAALNAHASLEVAQATVTILGNPYLLGATGSTKYQVLEQKARSLQPTGDNNDIFKHWGAIPALAKINIRMPRSNDDFKLMEQGGGDFTQPFWYDGYYYVYSIKHMFRDGLFTQELSMVALLNQSKLNQYLTQGKDDSKGFICEEYNFGDGSTINGSGVSSKVPIDQQYTNSQLIMMTRTLQLAALALGKVNDLQTIQITRAIVLNESLAGDFKFPGGQAKIGDVGQSHLSYGITQFGLATLRDTLKADPQALALFNDSSINDSSVTVANVDSIPEKNLINALYKDIFALAMTMSRVDFIRKQLPPSVGHFSDDRRDEFPEFVFRKYNGGLGATLKTLDSRNITYARNALQNYLNIQTNKQPGFVDSVNGVIPTLHTNIFDVALRIPGGTFDNPPKTTIGEKTFDTYQLITDRIIQLGGGTVIPGQGIGTEVTSNTKPTVESTTAGDLLSRLNPDQIATGDASTTQELEEARARQKEKKQADEKKRACGNT